MNAREQHDPQKQPILVSVPELSTMLNLGRTATWELARKHKIKSIKIGRTRRVPVAAIQEYLIISSTVRWHDGAPRQQRRQHSSPCRWALEARYTLPDGSCHSLMGKTRAEAARKLTEALRNLDRGMTTPRDERLTFGAYLDQWLTTKKLEVETSYWLRCEQYIQLHIKPSLGKVQLVKLTAHQLSTLYENNVDGGMAVHTLRHLHATIQATLEDAMRLDLVMRNVADLARPPKAPHLDMKVYTPEQANQLLEAAQGNRLESLYLGELLGLRWTAVDLERGEMQIITALKEVASQRSLGRPKTPRSRRTIPLTPLAVASLKRHRIKQQEECLKHGPDWNPQQLVFCTTTGTAYARNNWRLLQYKPMLRKAGLPYIKPHDLRHTAATLLLLEGAQPLVVSEMLGHASVAFTLATYGHVLAGMREPTRDAMERLFGGSLK